MDMQPGITEDPGNNTCDQLKVIRGGRGTNVISVQLKHMEPRFVEAFTATLYTSRLATSARLEADLESGSTLIVLN